MNNPVGYGVFGTFGDLHAYQQIFYNGAEYSISLDLDEDAIEFYPGNKLYSVRRTLENDVCTICFSVYSSALEINPESIGTFIGACVVLQDAYAETEYICNVLDELHSSVINSYRNLADSAQPTMGVHDIVVVEPDSLIALSANVIPIDKTPFLSTVVDVDKQYLVSPGLPASGNNEEQVLTFFDQALKRFTDAGTLYFSFDKRVNGFVSADNIISIIDWDAFTTHKTEKQPAHGGHSALDLPALEPDRYIIASSQMPDATIDSINNAAGIPPKAGAGGDRFERETNNVAKPEDDDPYKPFNMWEDPVPSSGWGPDVVRARMKEYNRLFKYTNTLLDHINEPPGKRWKFIKMGERRAARGEEGPFTRTRKKVVLLLLFIVVVGCTAIYFLWEEEDDYTALVANIAPPLHEQPGDNHPADNDTIPLTVVQPPVVPQKVRPTTITPVVQENEEDVVADETPTLTPAVPETITSSPYEKVAELNPKPNFELSQNDVSALRQSGLKDKTLIEIVKLLFDNVPSNIGNIYKGQETGYAATLLNNNKLAFQKSGDNYICTTDNTLLRIPAYVGQRPPAATPK